MLSCDASTQFRCSLGFTKRKMTGILSMQKNDKDAPLSIHVDVHLYVCTREQGSSSSGSTFVMMAMCRFYCGMAPDERYGSKVGSLLIFLSG